MSRIEVQDILIIFQYYFSQDILIRDRTVINFGKISRNQFNSSRKPSEQVKMLQILGSNYKNVFPWHSFGAGHLLDWRKFPPGCFFRTGHLLGTLEWIPYQLIWLNLWFQNLRLKIEFSFFPTTHHFSISQNIKISSGHNNIMQKYNWFRIPHLKTPQPKLP